MGQVTIGYTSDKELQANSQQEVGQQSINMMFGGAHGMAVVSHVSFQGSLAAVATSGRQS